MREPDETMNSTRELLLREAKMQIDENKRIEIAAMFMDKFILYTDTSTRKRDLARMGLAFADALIAEARDNPFSDYKVYADAKNENKK
jgi:hypothetical protein